jgi:hypothetical protein
VSRRRNALVALLLLTYPRRWREEYGPELEALLVTSTLTPRVVVNVLWNGLWQRGRSAWQAGRRPFRRRAATRIDPVYVVRHRRFGLLRRAGVACLAMEILSALIGGVMLRNTSEFGGFVPGMIFAAAMSVPLVMTGAFLVFLPAMSLARWLVRDWSNVLALVAGALLSPVAFAVVVSSSWVIEGMAWSFHDHWANVLSQPRSYAILIPVYTLGGVIVALPGRMDRLRLSKRQR